MNQRDIRIERQQAENEQRLEAKAIQKLDNLNTLNQTDNETLRKKAIVQAAINRARARRASEN